MEENIKRWTARHKSDAIFLVCTTDSKLGCETGIEPVSRGPQPRALPLSYKHHRLARAAGIEPAPAESKSAALPLSYAPIFRESNGIGAHPLYI